MLRILSFNRNVVAAVLFGIVAGAAEIIVYRELLWKYVSPFLNIVLLITLNLVVVLTCMRRPERVFKVSFVSSLVLECTLVCLGLLLFCSEVMVVNNSGSHLENVRVEAELFEGYCGGFFPQLKQGVEVSVPTATFWGHPYVKVAYEKNGMSFRDYLDPEPGRQRTYRFVLEEHVSNP
ncbi:hypothetical protein GYB59_20685 [bacterium]|nr:hypothetical protein [bacterium]